MPRSFVEPEPSKRSTEAENLVHEKTPDLPERHRRLVGPSSDPG
jgi:hypothetical protein